MTWNGVGEASCQVTVGGRVTGVDDSITSSSNFNGDLTLGILSRSLSLDVWQP